MIIPLPWLAPPVIEFTVRGEPASKSRARFTGRGSKVRAFTPEKTRQAEQAMAAAYLAVTHRVNKADSVTAYAIEAEFHLTRNQRRDVDNMAKLVLDGLNQVAWEDDSQVTRITAEKFFHSDDARTVVRIQAVGKIPRSEASCERCGTTFPRPPSHAAKKYCSTECRKANIAQRRTRTCTHCGNAFVKNGDAVDQRYCSPSCVVASKHVTVVCVSCETTFTKDRSLVRSGNAYCSDTCKATYWRLHRKSDPKGTCLDCGGPTTKATYKRCRDCSYAAGGRHNKES